MTRRILSCAIVSVLALSLGATASAAPPPPSTASVVLQDSPLSFKAKVVVLTLDKGGRGTATVTWTWDTTSTRPHNVEADDSSFNSHPGCNSGGGFYGADTSLAACGFTAASSFTQTFRKPGVYRYHCAVHGGAGGAGMAGMVVVKGPPLKRRA